MKKTTTAFVASTLPALFLVNNIEKNKITRIILRKKIHYESYLYIQKKFPNIQIELIEENVIKELFYIALILLNVKINKNKIIFFHECCWPILDILINIIKPNGLFVPQIHLFVGQYPIDFLNLPPPSSWSGWCKRKIFTQFENLFKIYDFKNSVDGAANFALSCNKYPLTIKKIDLPIFKYGKNNLSKNHIRNVILLTGTHLVEKHELIKLFNEIIKILKKEKYTIYIKDHPTDRLNYSFDDCINIEASMPIELINIEIDILISISSAVLSRIGNTRISILHLLNTMSELDKKNTKLFLEKLPEYNEINFVYNYEDFQNIIKNLKNEN
jgi:hypothetical protein